MQESAHFLKNSSNTASISRNAMYSEMPMHTSNRDREGGGGERQREKEKLR
jgi:hypothetical protein